MRAAALTVLIVVLAGCSPDPEEPRDSKVPRPQMDLPTDLVPRGAGPEGHPAVMRAVLRCQLDREGNGKCQPDVPRALARMG